MPSGSSCRNGKYGACERTRMKDAGYDRETLGALSREVAEKPKFPIPPPKDPPGTVYERLGPGGYQRTGED